MIKISKKITGAGLLAAMGLSALSPMQQGALTLSVAAAAMWAAPAMATIGIPGVGIVVKKKPGNAPIILPSDKDGIVRLTGLEPGEYEVKLLGNSAPVTMKVGRDGKLAVTALRDVKGGPDVKSADPRARRALPVVREWLEPVAFGEEGGSGTIIAIVAAAAQAPDVNTSTVEQLMRGTNNSREAAALIVAERKKGGPYKDPLNFAQRVGKSVTVDFGYSSVRIGDTMIIARGVDPKNPGFKTVVGSGVVELYGKKHNYVGHVTLLR